MENNITKFVYVSSCSIYNCTYDKLDITEDDFDAGNDLNYYIKTKIMSEKMIKDYSEKHDISYSIIRPHGIFGIGDVSIMPRLIKVNAKIGIPLFNGGNNLIDIVCAENVAYSLWLCANSDKNGTYNITNGEIFRYKDMIDKIFSQMGLVPKYFPMRFKVAYLLASMVEGIYKFLRIENEPIITKYTLTTVGVSQTLNIECAKRDLGYVPQKTLQEGIDDYAKWSKENS